MSCYRYINRKFSKISRHPFHYSQCMQFMVMMWSLMTMWQIVSPLIADRVTAPTVSDEQYWQRCCQDRWPLCVVADYGGSWKRMYFERHIQHEVETYVPLQSDDKQVSSICKQCTQLHPHNSHTSQFEAMLKLCSPYVERLEVSQLLPPSREHMASVEDDDGER